MANFAIDGIGLPPWPVRPYAWSPVHSSSAVAEDHGSQAAAGIRERSIWRRARAFAISVRRIAVRAVIRRAGPLCSVARFSRVHPVLFGGRRHLCPSCLPDLLLRCCPVRRHGCMGDGRRWRWLSGRVKWLVGVGAPPAWPVSAAPGSRLRAHPLRGGPAAPLRIPGAGASPLSRTSPDQTCLAAGEGARRAAVPVRLRGRARGCRLPEFFTFVGDGAPAAPGDRLRLQGGVHNACALRRLPPCSPVPARALGHRAKNSGRRRPAADARPMRSGTLSQGAPNLGIRQGSLSFSLLFLSSTS
ncbi:hypothetical protein QF040_001477 [Variovorax sp. W2I14]